MKRTLALLILGLIGCGMPQTEKIPPMPDGILSPAYPKSDITDPALVDASKQIHSYVNARKSAAGDSLFSKTEILAPAKIVLPYGVGVFQQELRLPVILTTNKGWRTLKQEEKELEVKSAFQQMLTILQKMKTPLKPSLTIQTPQGLEISWINELNGSGKLVFGDEDS